MVPLSPLKLTLAVQTDEEVFRLYIMHTISYEVIEVTSI